MAGRAVLVRINLPRTRLLAGPPAGLLSLTKDLLSAPTAIPNRLVFSLNLDSRNLEFESLCRLLLSWYQGLELQVSTSLRPPAPRPSVDVILHSDPAKLKRAVLQHLPELGLVVDVADSAEGLRATEQWLEGVNDLRSPLPPAGLRSLLLPTALPLDPEIPIAEGTENTQDDDEKQNESQPMLPQFEETVLGGTFDRLHAGHKLLLQTTAYLARRVLWVGVSAGPLLTKKRHGWSLQGWPRRAAGVHSFVGLCRPNLKVRCEELFDSYGPSLHPTVEALVVSKETEAGGPLVNRKRAELGRSPLELFVIPLASDNRSTDKISSTYLRQQELSVRADRVALLRSDWQRLALDCLAPDFAEADDFEARADFCQGWWDRLHDSYDQPSVGDPEMPARPYHNLIHVADLLRLVDEFTSPKIKARCKPKLPRPASSASIKSLKNFENPGDTCDGQGELPNGSLRSAEETQGEDASQSEGFWLKRPRLVQLAVWFHDAVYDPKDSGGENERCSAELFLEFATEARGLSPSEVEWVRQAILATVAHQVPAGFEEDKDLKACVPAGKMCNQSFLDFDLSVLGRPPMEYGQYAEQIRQEYAWIPELDFCRGRTAVLCRLLEKPQLFETPHLRDRYEALARFNMRAEIRMLEDMVERLTTQSTGLAAAAAQEGSATTTSSRRRQSLGGASLWALLILPLVLRSLCLEFVD